MDWNQFFSASTFADEQGVLQYEKLRLVRNFSRYYQELFSVFKKTHQENLSTDGVFFQSGWHNLFKVGHHAAWQTLADCTAFYKQVMEEENLEKRALLLCAMMSQQGWGHLHCTRQSTNSFLYEVVDSLEAAESQDIQTPQCAFLAGIVLALHLTATLRVVREEITLSYLDKILEDYGNLVKEEACQNVPKKCCIFTARNPL